MSAASIMNEFCYTNPITSGLDLAMRDYQIIKDGSTWYMTGTSLPVWSGANPGVKLFSSTDLLHWRFERFIVDSSALPDNCLYNGRFWAPEIHNSCGRFYLTVNSGHDANGRDPKRMTDHGIFLFAADCIIGPYEQVGNGRVGGKESGFKNDASLFTDDDGRTYIYCSGGGLWQAEINLSAARLIGGEFLKIRSPGDPGNPDWMIGGIEGPFIIKRHNRYFLFFSAWTRGYEIGVMESESPLGPWTLSQETPLMGSRKRRYRERQMIEGGYSGIEFADTDDPFVETGHCSVFEGPDCRDWICCHYLAEGKVVASETPVIEYADSFPQLGIEPLIWQNGKFKINGPTWTEQLIL